jgi:hypothetical protein
MIAGVRDWLERSHGHAQLLVLVDEGPYLARMQRGPGGDRIAERRELWRRFVEERGLDACFVDLGQRGTAIDESAGRIRATLWQASADA